MIAIGIDIGGTATKMLALSASGRVLKTHRFKTPLGGQKAFMDNIAAVVNAWKRGRGAVVLGVGLPGDTDHEHGMLRWAPNLPWRNLKIKDYLERATGCECYVSNDANMAAFGISRCELKGKYKDLLVITMGTGIGGGVIVNGKICNGYSGSAGEIGHAKIDFSANAPKCGCGNRGCLEAFCGTYAIKRAAMAAAKKHPGSILAKLLKEGEFSVKILSDAAAKGDKLALALWRDIGTALGRGVANAVLLLNPQAVVLAGGVARGAKYFKRAAEAVFKEQSVKTPFKNLKIICSRTPDIGAVGAAAYAMAKIDED